MEWDSTTHLLAATVDHLAVANWMTATINSGEDGDPLEYPEAVPRPRPDGGTSDADTARDEEHPAPGQPGADQLMRFFS
ncbi:hypothetical protein [Streptomyces sp. NPDC056670]|uniref:hypothetical protein n=1 Tax=Streptomyces sp. NPDC056670 TaxID=3345904 RepID=UPI0036D13146